MDSTTLTVGPHSPQSHPLLQTWVMSWVCRGPNWPLHSTEPIKCGNIAEYQKLAHTLSQSTAMCPSMKCRLSHMARATLSLPVTSMEVDPLSLQNF